METQEFCDGCSLNLMEVHELLSDKDNLLDFLFMHDVLSANPVVCPNCNKPCKLYPSDNYRYRCTNRVHPAAGNKKKVAKRIPCTFKVGAKRGTFFENAHLPITTICRFVFYWVGMKPQQEWLMDELSLSSDTVVNWATYCREVCLVCLIDVSEKVGGEGITVQIDEGKMGKREYNRGRIIEGRWIFGGFERHSRKLFVVPVQERSKEQLINVVKDWVLPGTTIISDCWKTYNCSAEECFQHQAVNSSKNFVDSSYQAYTQNVEGDLGDVPKFVWRESHFPGYLAENFFRRKYPDHREMYHIFFKCIGQIYPPSNGNEYDTDNLSSSSSNGL